MKDQETETIESQATVCPRRDVTLCHINKYNDNSIIIFIYE